LVLDTGVLEKVRDRVDRAGFRPVQSIYEGCYSLRVELRQLERVNPKTTVRRSVDEKPGIDSRTDLLNVR
jgi:hypothetical protein